MVVARRLCPVVWIVHGLVVFGEDEKAVRGGEMPRGV